MSPSDSEFSTRELSFSTTGWGAMVAERGSLPFDVLDDLTRLQGLFSQCLSHFDDSAPWVMFKRFHPQGVSFALLGKRARVVVHTWPEQGALTLDVSAELTVLQELFAACSRGIAGLEVQRAQTVQR